MASSATLPSAQPIDMWKAWRYIFCTSVDDKHISGVAQSYPIVPLIRQIRSLGSLLNKIAGTFLNLASFCSY